MSTVRADPGPAMPAPAAPAGVVRGVLPVEDPAADAWRAVARMIGWICVAYGGLLLAAFVIDSVGRGAMFSEMYALRWNVRQRDAMSLIMGVMQVWGLLVACALLVGGIATVRRRRWGPAVLLAYAVGCVPNQVWAFAWVAKSVIDSSRRLQLSPSIGYQIATYTLHSLTYLAFPAIVFYVMTRRPVRRQFAPINPPSAFEPLPPTAAGDTSRGVGEAIVPVAPT